jgi:hypothetical protein
MHALRFTAKRDKLAAQQFASPSVSKNNLDWRADLKVPVSRIAYRYQHKLQKD